MRAILLCAGRGSRMNIIQNFVHKSLLKLNENESFLTRILHQLIEYDFKEVVIVTGYKSLEIEKVANKFQLPMKFVFNSLYEKDTNIWSMKLALENLSSKKDPVLIIEADTYISNITFNSIFNTLKKNTSTWFTKGQFKKNQVGGILKSNDGNKVEKIEIVKKFNKKFFNYYKLSGIMVIKSDHIKPFFDLIIDYSKNSIRQYYLKPWYENLEILKSNFINFKEQSIISANTIDEYNYLLDIIKRKKNIKIELVNTKNLIPIEGFIDQRKNDLLEDIKNEGKWIKPIIIEKNHNLILDGHHRFEVAKILNLTIIPCIKVDYDDVEIWSLRDDCEVSHELVIKNALAKNLYPCKTVKHDFNFVVDGCNYKLNELKK